MTWSLNYLVSALPQKYHPISLLLSTSYY